jgi:hypothetical protein
MRVRFGETNVPPGHTFCQIACRRVLGAFDWIGAPVTDTRLIAMDTERPFDGHVPSGGEEPSYRWLDEWLCEYVDGTMDPSLEAVFEQYVEANPDLKAHIERLQKTRDLLCNCGLPKEPPADVEEEVCREVACDEQASSSEAEPDRYRPLTALGVVSSVAVALVVGFLVGATMVNPSPSGLSSGIRVGPDARVPASPSPSQATVKDRVERHRLYQPTGTLFPADSARRSFPLTPLGGR